MCCLFYTNWSTLLFLSSALFGPFNPQAGAAVPFSCFGGGQANCWARALKHTLVPTNSKWLGNNSVWVHFNLCLVTENLATSTKCAQIYSSFTNIVSRDPAGLALALMGHDDMTLNHHHNLLTDRQKWDRSITDGSTRWQSERLEGISFENCDTGRLLQRRALNSESGNHVVKLPEGPKWTSDAFHSPHCPVSSSPWGRALKASSLLQKTHINILFEFPTSRHNSYLISWLKGDS